MSVEAKPAAARPNVGLRVTISRHSRFAHATSALAVKAAEFFGCSHADAKRMGQLLDQVIEAALRIAPPNSGPSDIGILFRRSDEALDIELSCEVAAGLVLRDAVMEVAGRGWGNFLECASFESQGTLQHCVLSCRSSSG